MVMVGALIIMRDILFEEVTAANERMKVRRKRKCLGQPSTVHRQRYGLRVVEDAERL